MSGDDVKTENPHEQDADIDRRRKQIALREIHTYPGCEDLSAVGIYPVTDEVVESNWSVQVVSGEALTPSHKPRCDLRQA